MEFKISFKQFFFLKWKLCMKCIYLHNNFSLWSELLRILLRWTNDCFGKLHGVLAAFAAALINVSWEGRCSFQCMQLVHLEGVSNYPRHWKMCLSRTGCADGEPLGNYQQMSDWSVCLCHECHLLVACVWRGIRWKPAVTIVWHCTGEVGRLLVPGVSKLAN